MFIIMELAAYSLMDEINKIKKENIYFNKHDI